MLHGHEDCRAIGVAFAKPTALRSANRVNGPQRGGNESLRAWLTICRKAFAAFGFEPLEFRAGTAAEMQRLDCRAVSNAVNNDCKVLAIVFRSGDTFI